MPAPTNKLCWRLLSVVTFEFWHTRPEVSDFSAQAESTDEPHIQAPTNLEYAGGGSGFARLFPPKSRQNFR